ncbi:hypothetical protein C6P40_005172 [Pichia californica]|uniref:Uncharacterized protein n=1 Tax=Pichia californica TaxID=460514 RepID=A0A9P6WLR7_9ASCO|nr:hypothetical protein C6P42_005440 [[Candida] californica]KAG0689350.1 hypothetical protein C6P40_005172 [[Candida] californica]
MPPRRTKLVKLKIASDELVKFPELTAHVQVKPPKQPRLKSKGNNENPNLFNNGNGNGKVTKLKIKGNSISIIESASTSRDSSLKSIDSTDTIAADFNNGSTTPTSGNISIPILNPTSMSSTLISASASSKLSSNVRVGVSGLAMNTSIVRELETSGHVGEWRRFENISTEKKVNDQPYFDNKIKLPNLNELDENHSVISMRDYRGYKELDIKDKQNEIIQYAQSKGRKIIRGFSGYLMLWPSWHKVKEGSLKKKVLEDSDEKRSDSTIRKIKESETPNEAPKPDLKPDVLIKPTCTEPPKPIITSLSDILEATAALS